MNRVVSWCGVVCLAVCLLLSVGCEWTGGGGTDSFNTSQGAGININFTGVYDGNLGGGKAVSSTSGGTITRLTIQQTGNRLDVTDNHGSKYVGSVGTPGAIVDLANTTLLPDGAELVQSQMSWSGKDGVANKDVNFVGVVHAVSITDIHGNKTTSDETTTTTTTTISTNGFNNAVTITTVENGYDLAGRLVFTTTTTETTQPSGEKTTSTKTETFGSSSSTEFLLTEANTQYRLEGTWVEQGGKASSVDALSPGGNATLASTATTTTTATP